MANFENKLSPDRVRVILDWVRRGHYRSVACAKARISDRTLRNWVEKGREGLEPYAQFLEDLLEAEADCEDEMLSRIRSVSSKDDAWTNVAWFMERRWPRRWRGSIRVTVAEQLDLLIARFASDPDVSAKILAALASEGDLQSDDGAEQRH